MAVIIPKCVNCNVPMVKRKSARGEFFGCKNFPRCRQTREVIDYPDLPDNLPPGNPEQLSIWDFLANGTENALVEARAGSGKTYTITNGVLRLRGLKIAVFSFNNHIIKEMNNQLRKNNITWVKGLTYNSFGFRTVKQAYPNVELVDDKLDQIIEALYPFKDDDAFVVKSATAKLARLCKCYLDDGDDTEVLNDLIERFNVDLDGDGGSIVDAERRFDIVADLVPKVLKGCLDNKSIMDFDDQVWWVVKMNLPVQRFDMVLVDEAQDTNKMQQVMVQMACP